MKSDVLVDASYAKGLSYGLMDYVIYLAAGRNIGHENHKKVSGFRVQACPGATGCGYVNVFAFCGLGAFHHHI